MKSKERSKIEYYKGIIRQLKSDNARLRKILARYESIEPEEEYEEEIKPSKVKKCPLCYDGILRDVEVAGRILTNCEDCKYRKSEKL